MLKNIFGKNKNITKEEVIALQSQVNNWEQKAAKIRAKFNFVLPNYIVDEIIENDENKNYVNLHYLINCAVLNNKISHDNGMLLKQIYH